MSKFQSLLRLFKTNGEPANAVTGDMYYNLAQDGPMVRTSAGFQPMVAGRYLVTDGWVGNHLYGGDVAPVSPFEGDLWIDSTQVPSFPTYTSGNLPTSGLVGSVAYVADDNVLAMWTGTDWMVIADPNPWSTYVPTYSNVTIGNAAVVARWKQIGKTVTVQFRLTAGSTTTFNGGNTFIVGLPVAPAYASTTDIIGSCYCYDSSSGSASRRPGIVSCSAGSAYFSLDAACPTVTGTAPWTWAVGDSLAFTAQYEVF